MTGDRHPLDSQEEGRDGRGAGREASDPTGRDPADLTHESAATRSPEATDVDELEARLHQKEAAMQNVIDRYEAVLEQQRRAPDRASRGRGEDLIESAAEGCRRLLRDLEAAIRGR